MKIGIRVAIEDGWLSFQGNASQEDVAKCYALPKTASRADYWSKVTSQKIPDGRGMIWQLIEQKIISREEAKKRGLKRFYTGGKLL